MNPTAAPPRSNEPSARRRPPRTADARRRTPPPRQPLRSRSRTFPAVNGTAPIAGVRPARPRPRCWRTLPMGIEIVQPHGPAPRPHPRRRRRQPSPARQLRPCRQRPPPPLQPLMPTAASGGPVGPPNATPLPPVEKPAAAPDAINDAAGHRSLPRKPRPPTARSPRPLRQVATSPAATTSRRRASAS